jgi:hypothetical protein
MAKPLIGTNVKIEVQKTLGSDIHVTAVTKDAPGVATATAHGLVDGDLVVFTVAGGMVELDGQVARVDGKTTDTFDLEGIDTTTFSTWTEGTINKVTAYETMDSAQSVTMPNPAPAKLDATTLIDKSKQVVYGLPEAPDGSITGLFNPAGAAETLIRTATNGNENVVFRINFADGRKSIFNAAVSGGYGFDLATNAVAHQTISFTPRKMVCHFAD